MKAQDKAHREHAAIDPALIPFAHAIEGRQPICDEEKLVDLMVETARLLEREHLRHQLLVVDNVDAAFLPIAHGRGFLSDCDRSIDIRCADLPVGKLTNAVPL